MRIAVIGGGISGNVAARLLALAHNVTLFESEARPGGHARTLDITVAGTPFAVDTGFMVFNERTYPNFCRLLELLKIECADTDMSLSVRCDGDGVEFQGSSLNGLFAQRRNLFRPAFLRMLADILRFNRDAARWMTRDLGAVTVGELLHEHGYGNWFVSRYLIPMTAAIWSCPACRILEFPAHFLLGFLHNHGLLQVAGQPQWKYVPGGSRRYVEALLEPLGDRVVTGTEVVAVRRLHELVEVSFRDRPSQSFDAVVLACHADRTLAILSDADGVERHILGSFPYQDNLALVHTDASLLPVLDRAWASWNYRVSSDESTPVAVTYDLSRLQSLKSPSPILLTLNGEDRVDPALVIDRHVFRHPMFTSASVAAQGQHSAINGRRRTYFCGAYWGYGFHEDGVNSALAVARCFGLGWDQWKAVCTRASSYTSV